MSTSNIFEESHQDEEINDIRVDDLKANAFHTHTIAFTLNRMECTC